MYIPSDTIPSCPQSLIMQQVFGGLNRTPLQTRALRFFFGVGKYTPMAALQG